MKTGKHIEDQFNTPEQLAAEGKLAKIFSDENFWVTACKTGRIGVREAVTGLRRIRYFSIKELCKMLDIPFEKHYKVLHALRCLHHGKPWAKCQKRSNKKLDSNKK